MPKATAVWLIDNTALTFDQIGDFCNLHRWVQAIADGEIAGMQGYDSVVNAQLSREEITRCEADSEARLNGVIEPAATDRPYQRPALCTRGAARRQAGCHRLAGQTSPELSDAQIGKLIGTTKIPSLKSDNTGILPKTQSTCHASYAASLI